MIEESAGCVSEQFDPLDVELLLEQFDIAWIAGAVPSIREFLPPCGPADQLVLEELIMIDLEYRWQQGRPLEADYPHEASGVAPNESSRGPLLEDYVRFFPELGPAGGLSLALICEEYWARHRWGDPPEIKEYAQRFPLQGKPLFDALRRTDAELEELR
jgi:hypothetical protein